MPENAAKKISRRDAIKILTAAAGAATLANIPSKWSKPGLEVGMLPAHAQTSVGHTLAAGASDPAANYCFPFISTVTLTPPTLGILMRYNITTSGVVVLSIPATPTGTVPTDASGIASLSVTVNSGAPFNTGDIVTVTWSFVNPSDGTGTGAQAFTSAGGGC